MSSVRSKKFRVYPARRSWKLKLLQNWPFGAVPMVDDYCDFRINQVWMKVVPIVFINCDALSICPLGAL